MILLFFAILIPSIFSFEYSYGVSRRVWQHHPDPTQQKIKREMIHLYKLDDATHQHTDEEIIAKVNKDYAKFIAHAHQILTDKTYTFEDKVGATQHPYELQQLYNWNRWQIFSIFLYTSTPTVNFLRKYWWANNHDFDQDPPVEISSLLYHALHKKKHSKLIFPPTSYLTTYFGMKGVDYPVHGKKLGEMLAVKESVEVIHGPSSTSLSLAIAEDFAECPKLEGYHWITDDTYVGPVYSVVFEVVMSPAILEFTEKYQMHSGVAEIHALSDFSREQEVLYYNLPLNSVKVLKICVKKAASAKVEYYDRVGALQRFTKYYDINGDNHHDKDALFNAQGQQQNNLEYFEHNYYDLLTNFEYDVAVEKAQIAKAKQVLKMEQKDLSKAKAQMNKARHMERLHQKNKF